MSLMKRDGRLKPAWPKFSNVKVWHVQVALTPGACVLEWWEVPEVMSGGEDND